MLVRPLPGTKRESLLETLRDVGTKAGNLRSGGHTNQQLYNEYSSWVANSARMLRHQVSPADVERLLLTPRYWALQSSGGGEVLLATRHLLDTEVDEREAAFNDAVTALHEEIVRWSGPGVFVVPDTSVYLEHEQKLEDLDVGALVDTYNRPVHLIFPITVIDELDSLKRSKDRRLRWRAGYTLAVVDRLLEQPKGVATLRRADGGTGRGEVTVEIVFDPPAHQRLPITDDEIVDRTLAIQGVAGRAMTLITYDTSQSTRARAQGLTVVKLDHPRSEDEPERAP